MTAASETVPYAATQMAAFLSSDAGLSQIPALEVRSALQNVEPVEKNACEPCETEKVEFFQIGVATAGIAHCFEARQDSGKNEGNGLSGPAQTPEQQIRTKAASPTLREMAGDHKDSGGVIEMFNEHDVL